MKRIVFISSTRADYNLISPFYKSLIESDVVKPELLITGTHLLKRFGYTLNDVKEDDVVVDYKLHIFSDEHLEDDTSINMANALVEFSKFLKENKPDFVALLGDRFEILSAALASYNLQIPIIHFYGGETTEGANDESYRHAITKLSNLHFTSTELHKQRVIQLGENPKTVFNIGAVGIENILNIIPMSKLELEESLNISLNEKISVVTYHPETLGKDNPIDTIDNILKACKNNNDISFVFTKANVDFGGQIINEYLEKHIKNIENCYLFDSLGATRYFSLLMYSSFVLGNSSSGLIEVPSFKIPTINIGDRQKGRLQAESVINCDGTYESIENAIKRALAYDKNLLDKVVNPYGDGLTTSKFKKIINNPFIFSSKNTQKKFRDWSFDYE